MSARELEKAVEELPAREFEAFAQWFERYLSERSAGASPGALIRHEGRLVFDGPLPEGWDIGAAVLQQREANQRR